MTRYGVIASQTHSHLYSYLQRQFAEDDEVHVLVDRRHEQRRQRVEARDRDRRWWARRNGRGKDLGFDHHGFQVVHQLSEGLGVRMQWRPPWWDTDKPGGLVRQEESQRSSEPHAIETILVEHDRVMARAETAERKCAWLEEELRNLRIENERFRREQMQFVETLKTVTRHLAECAGESS